MYPKISSSIEILFEGNNRYSIFNKVTGKTYEISNNEVIILEKLDGTNDITCIPELCNDNHSKNRCNDWYIAVFL